MYYHLLLELYKIDTTNLGSDLLPAVDNVNTFADTFYINPCKRTICMILPMSANSDDHVLGSINNDPFFGKTTANIYLQLKPSFFPYYLGIPKIRYPLVGIDSVVFALSTKVILGRQQCYPNLQVSEVSR